MALREHVMTAKLFRWAAAVSGRGGAHSWNRMEALLPSSVGQGQETNGTRVCAALHYTATSPPRGCGRCDFHMLLLPLHVMILDLYRNLIPFSLCSTPTLAATLAYVVAAVIFLHSYDVACCWNVVVVSQSHP